ncbi:MAG: iron ABC transporter permease [Rubrivivax sp.]|nr:iron ABC transporter permease [Rubrivivax sp.]
MSVAAARHRSPAVLVAVLGAAAVGIALLGLLAGSDGWSLAWIDDWPLITAIRAPRTLGAALAGALLGLSGALAQGVFRNPLADPYLLGSAAGAGLAVVLVLAAGGLLGSVIGLANAELLVRTGLVAAAFAGALAGVALTLVLARGAGRRTVLLLSGVVVGVLLTAVADLVLLAAPEAMRGKQVFLLGTTGFFGWPSVGLMAAVLAVVLPASMALARVLDALVLGEGGAASLGLPVARLRLVLVALMALATGTAVAQAGLVAFVGLVSPHLVRRWVTVRHAALLALSSLAGAVLLMAADLMARTVIAPEELPVGILTAVLGGLFLMRLLHRQGP